MYSLLNSLLYGAVNESYENLDLEASSCIFSKINPLHEGDVSTNVAFILAKKLSVNPNTIAKEIVAKLPKEYFSGINIVGGFINVYINPAKLQAEIFTKDLTYADGLSGKSVYLEYVSVNPTGPLHVGHGRNLVFGSILSKVLLKNQAKLHQEYYLNDGGRQMDILAISVICKLLKHPLPSNAYQGEYISTMAKSFASSDSFDYINKPPVDHIDDQEQLLDFVIQYYKKHFSKFNAVFNYALEQVVIDIKQDLLNFGVTMHWFSEKSLLNSKQISNMLKQLTPFCEQKNGALWFKATQFGDEKDRVLVRSNGEHTYFANDLCYHHHKLASNPDLAINIWGADHHGYGPRIYAGLKALGHNVEHLKIIYIQFANLFDDGKKLQMSTRKADYITLRALYDEIGVEATKFFYALRKQDQHLDFDIKLAKLKSSENPLYYIQYAHARICRVLEKNSINPEFDTGILNQDAKKILLVLDEYSSLLTKIAHNYQIHLLPNYLYNLANLLHSFYGSNKLIAADISMNNAHLKLIQCIKAVLADGLSLMGIKPKEKM